MRLTSLHLRTPELRLDDLSPGFNVVYAPQAETRRLVPAALRCVLFGAPADWLPADERQSLCELGVLSPWGRFNLERVATPTSDRLIARDSSGENRSQWLRERVLGEFPEAAFAAIFTPRFGDHAAFESLVRQAHGESGAAERRAALESLLRELEASRPWERQDEQAAKLRECEARLLAEIEQLEIRCARPVQPHSARRERCEQQLALWQRRLRIAQRKLEDATERLRVARERPLPPPQDESLRQRLARTARQITRLEGVLEDLKQRGRELRQRLAKDGAAPPDAVREQLAAKYHRLLFSLTTIARKLESEIKTLNTQPTADGQWTTATTRLLPRLESLNQKLEILCKRLQQDETSGRRAHLEHEYRQVAECQAEVGAQLDLLLKRRDAIRKRLAAFRRAEAVHLPEIEALEAIHARADRRERRCRERVIRWRRRLEQLPASRPSTARYEPRLAEARAELAAVRDELAQLNTRGRGESEAMLSRFRDLLAERRYSAIFDEASRTLRQLTDGELVALRPRTWGNDVVIEHARGKAVTFDVLSRAERDQVHLSLALATAADAAQRGCAFPLVLNDALRHIEPGRLRTAIELLRDYCRLHGQVVLLTSQQNVATLCRSVGVASFYLERPVAPMSRVVDDFESRSDSIHDDYRSSTPSAHVHEVTWDCEEFPGELRDRTLYGAVRPGHDEFARPASVRSTAAWRDNEPSADDEGSPEEVLRPSGYFLQLCDRVSEIPFLTYGIAREIESFGVYTVANFLHADPARLAERMHGRGLSVSDVRRWQGQARLMCGVRKLRSYDAKILVACGVTSPEQLADIRPHELSEMVEAFVATPEGSRLVRSGSDFEITRITRWIRSIGRAADDELAALEPIEKPVVAESVPPRDRKAPSTARAAARRKDTSERKRSSRRVSAAESDAERDVLPLKFHLELSSHIEAAPSIGPQMAKQLETIGITQVAHLLTRDPADVAQQLGNRRVSADVVHQWQRQAELVCRIPQLRGHDAQILVACEVETPEQLAAFTPAELGERVLPFARSKHGQRILRNASAPTLDEIADWIRWAKQARQVHAA